MASANVRRPAVAGLFYPRNPERLRGEVASLLAEASTRAVGNVKAVIAPHAGYIYSGGIAAAAFASLRERAKGIERAGVIGPAHYGALRGIAVPTSNVFERPLGAVPC